MNKRGILDELKKVKMEEIQEVGVEETNMKAVEKKLQIKEDTLNLLTRVLEMKDSDIKKMEEELKEYKLRGDEFLEDKIRLNDKLMKYQEGYLKLLDQNEFLEEAIREKNKEIDKKNGTIDKLKALYKDEYKNGITSVETYWKEKIDEKNEKIGNLKEYIDVLNKNIYNQGVVINTKKKEIQELGDYYKEKVREHVKEVEDTREQLEISWNENGILKEKIEKLKAEYK